MRALEIGRIGSLVPLQLPTTRHSVLVSDAFLDSDRTLVLVVVQLVRATTRIVSEVFVVAVIGLNPVVQVVDLTTATVNDYVFIAFDRRCIGAKNQAHLEIVVLGG